MNTIMEQELIDRAQREIERFWKTKECVEYAGFQPGTRAFDSAVLYLRLLLGADRDD